MDGAVDQIKQKLDIVEVLGEYIRLAKAGRNWKARCPFHAEKTPSFMISQERQIWHCFGCGTGGDIFKFVMQIEGVEFPDALRILARKAGVVLKRQDPQVQSQKKRLYEICELAAKFFETQLHKSASAVKVREYLKERGLKSETIKTWRVGWAPDEWHALHDFLKSRGYKGEEILQTGLIIQKDSLIGSVRSGNISEFYDRFRSRIIFPIFDIQGQVIAFGGRIFGAKAKEDVAKYVNSPQTPLYDKSHVLYGLNKTKVEIRNNDLCIIVEGYMDLLMSWQAGTSNVVASSGTALTAEQLGIVSRYTKNLVFAFDADAAGENATRRSIDLALAQDFLVKIISMKDKDPAEVVKKNPAEWPKIVGQAQSIMDFYFASTFAKFNSQEIEGRREIKKALLPVIKVIGSKTEQSEWLYELAHRLRADEKDLRADLQNIKIAPPIYFVEKTLAPLQPPEPKSRLEGLEERFLGLCLTHPQHIQKLNEIGEQDFQNQGLGQIFHQLKGLSEKNKGNDPVGCLQKSLAPELKIQLEYLSLKIEQQPADELQIIYEIETCLRELKMIKIRQQLTALSFEIKDVQAAGNKENLKNLLDKFSQLSGELLAITKASFKNYSYFKS